MAALIAVAAGAAEQRVELTAVKVVGMQPVPSAKYAAASALAARGGAPLDIALAVAGAFDGRTQHLIPVNDGAEAPQAARVTVLRDGLRDDSVRGERWDIALERDAACKWWVSEVKRAWRCWRGRRPRGFAATPCA